MSAPAIDLDQDFSSLNIDDLEDSCFKMARKLKAIERLINDDGYAITFQTMGQYRSALLKAIRE